MRTCTSTAFANCALSAQCDDLELKHERAVFVTTRLRIRREDPSIRRRHSGRRLAPTKLVSFLSLFRQLRGLRKNRNWRTRCAVDAWNRSSRRGLNCEEPGHHERAAYHGGSLSVCVLDVGAFDFLLIFLAQRRTLRLRSERVPHLHDFQLSGQIIAGGRRSVKYEIGVTHNIYRFHQMGDIILHRTIAVGKSFNQGLRPSDKGA